MKSGYALKLSIMGLLIAVGILIPMVSPLKIVLEPASFTLASHVAIFIAMFISLDVAVAVTIGTTIGFFLGGFPLVIVARAASHLMFATVGALYLNLRHTYNIRQNPVQLRLFSLVIAIIHATFEVLAVTVFFFTGAMGTAYYQKGFLSSVLLLVGLGTVIHSLVDFEIANVVILALRRHPKLKSVV